MSINELLFTIVPLAATLCNLFLLITVSSAKKNKIINAFLLLLLCLTLWNLGSLFMRLDLYPSMLFWYEISVFAIFCMPYFIYNFMHEFTMQKGTFLKGLLFVGSVGCAVLNLLHIFISDPLITDVGDERVFTFTINPIIIIPIIIAGLAILQSVIMALRAIKHDGMSTRLFTPLLIGVVALFVGTLVEMIPGMGTFPNDTFVCLVNAFCIYYALYKRRLVTLQQMTSNRPLYFISIIITTAILASLYNVFDVFFNRNFAQFADYKIVVFACLCGIVTTIIYQFIFKLATNLFVKGQAARDNELKKFSVAISQTLKIDEISDIFMDFVADNIPDVSVHICAYNGVDDAFSLIKSSVSLTAKDFRLEKTHPAVVWLENNTKGIFLSDFKRTIAYKSMWEGEKQQIEELNTQYLLPIVCDGTLACVVLIAYINKKNNLTFNELSTLDSVAAILSISIKISQMYEQMHNEARKDPLTSLSNRRNFLEIAQNQLDATNGDSYTLILLDIDDFHLFNELYGTNEGDNMLKDFAKIVQSVIEPNGTVARYSGKEFMVSMPNCDVPTARSYVETIYKIFKKHLDNQTEATKRFLTFSAGICNYPVSAANLGQLITNVSLAVFIAKRNGKNQINVYNSECVIGENDLMLDINQARRKKEIADKYSSTIYALTAAINAKDHYTYAHSNNVSEYASILAENANLGSEYVEIVRQGGMLHDIGKIGIPEHILSKKGRLTDEEYTIMKTHVENSIDIIRHLPNLDYVLPIAIGHHESWDGKGYPRGLAGEDIPIGARCLCIADSFDAMISRRPYKEPMKVEDALQEIKRGLGRQFDPELGAKFIKLVLENVIEVKQGIEITS